LGTRPDRRCSKSLATLAIRCATVESKFSIGLLLYPSLLWSKKKADVVEHPRVFDHVGLLVIEPPGKAGLLFI
jgi:hypothetical protein